MFYKVMLLCFCLAAIVLLSPDCLLGYDEPNNTYFPPLKPPTYIYNVDTYKKAITGMSSEPNETMIMLESLQGLLLKHGNSEGIHIMDAGYYSSNFDNLCQRRFFSHMDLTGPTYSVWWLVSHFSNVFGGRYVLYDLTQPDSLNVARMASYKYDAIMIAKSIESTALANVSGLTKAIDVSTYDDQWIYDNWLPTWPRKDIAIDQFTTGSHVGCLNDYAAAIGPVCFHELNGTPLRLAFLSSLVADSPVLGWMETNYAELFATRDNAMHNVFWAAVNTTHNTALYSSFRDASKYPLRQQTHSSITASPNTHYITFVWSDGDNLSAQVLGYSWSTSWWASPYRGQVSIGWPLNTPVRDIMQPNIEYRYATASTAASAKDYFFAIGPNGYSYVSYFSSSARMENALRLGKYMQDLDLNILLFLDNAGLYRPAIYMPYLSQSQVNALFYWDVWGNYAKYQGTITWANWKPIISVYAIMQDDNYVDIANAIKSRPANPYSPDGYTMIGVNLWTDSVQDIVNCASLLPSNYKVVTPEEFVSLIRQNLQPTSISATNNIDLGSWQLASYGAPTDPQFTVTPNSTGQEVDGTPSTKFTVGPKDTNFCHSNMIFSPIDISDADSFEFDLYGNGSGAKIRFELYSTQYSAFIYDDIILNFVGWRHISAPFTSISYWPTTASLNSILSSINIFQVSGSWNSFPATFFIDNAKIVRQTPVNPADLNDDGNIDMPDVATFASSWLGSDAVADKNHNGIVNFADWAIFAQNWK